MSSGNESTTVLALESSCDDTACAVIKAFKEGPYTILSQRVISQIEVHKKFGGVVPEVASREHLAHIIPLVEETLLSAGVGLDDIDLFAATSGPGLVGSLLVGTQVAKSLAFAKQRPVLGVNHLEGHIMAVCFLEHQVVFPALALLVSGGHTCLISMDSFTTYHLMGQTRDDAAGEAFDKIGKIMGLGYPAGPAIDQLSKLGDADYLKIPKMMRTTTAGLDFSFSGLKTWAMQHLGKLSSEEKQNRLPDICASVQHAIVDQLLYKVQNALDTGEYRSLILSGGVACNQSLRQNLSLLAAQKRIGFYVPPKELCTDNAAMIACAGFIRYSLGERSDLDFPVRPNWPFPTVKEARE